MPPRAHLAGYRLIIATAIGILLSTACATTKMYSEWGVTEGFVSSVSVVRANGDDLLFQFRMQGDGVERQFVWARISREQLFRNPSNNTKDWKLFFGEIPPKLAAGSTALPPCLTVEAKERGTAAVRDACGTAERVTVVHYNEFYERRAPWRPFILPLATPLTVAFDIVSFPFGLIYLLLFPH